MVKTITDAHLILKRSTYGLSYVTNPMSVEYHRRGPHISTANAARVLARSMETIKVNLKQCPMRHGCVQNSTLCIRRERMYNDYHYLVPNVLLSD